VTGYELDRLELGHGAALCADAENTRTMWRDTWWAWLCAQPHNPADVDPPHWTPWGPM
jgi:hypothetical protein